MTRLRWAYCGCLAASWPAIAFAEPAVVDRPVVVEMFISQSCRHSPPAAAALKRLASRDDVVALAWHVDYWNALSSEKAGAWADPYVAPAAASRQRAYNARIRGRPMVMTPQAVVDGVISLAGEKAASLEPALASAMAVDEIARKTPARVTVAPAPAEGVFEARIDGVGAAYDAVLVSFFPSRVTDVAGGDNAGLIFEEANVVADVSLIGSAGAGDAGSTFAFPAPPEGMGCAVLAQEPGQGRIVAASYCD